MALWCNRILSLLVVVGYLAAAIVAESGEPKASHPAGIICVAAILLFPVALIWFPEQIGDYIGPVGRGGFVNQRSPAILVALMGWFFLVGLPLSLYLLDRFGR
jgi:hypothetical protein